MCSKVLHTRLLLGLEILLVALLRSTRTSATATPPWRCDTSSLQICPNCKSDIWNTCKPCSNTTSRSNSINANVCTSCSVALRSWGFDDLDRHGYIALNGKIAFSSYVSINTTPADFIPPWRGIILAQLNVNTCSISNVNDFDTYINTYGSEQLVSYISALAPGTVLVAITADEPSTSLTQAAVNSLQALGFSDAHFVAFRFKFAFVAVIGNPQATIYGIKDSFNGDLNLNVTIAGTPSQSLLPSPSPAPTTTISPPGNCTVNLRSWGLDDNDTHGYINLNGIIAFNSYVPKYGVYNGIRWRGIIIAQLDLVNCSIYNVRDFDTFSSVFASDELVTYIDSAPNGSYIVAITADEPSTNLSPAVATLQAIGFTNANFVSFRWKFAFVAKIGSPNATVSTLDNNLNGPVNLSYTIPNSENTSS